MTGACRAVTVGFATETASARTILIIEIAGLGDLLHSLPAMWSVRQRYPQAALHCLVRPQYASLLRLTPWIDRVWCYPAFGVLDRWRTAQALRAQHFDVAIDLMGSDHAALVGFVSGAGRRLVRRPGSLRRRPGWRWLATDVMQQPFADEPMYLQRWRCLQLAGFGSPPPRFALMQQASPAFIDADGSAYFHVSPYTKLSRKELPPAQMAALLRDLKERLPHLQLVLSCGRQPRERRALDELLGALPFVPWKVFAGTLDIPQLYTLIAGARLHLGGDTGSMHLAWLAETPSVCWFSAFANHRSWAPRGDRHALVYSTTPPGNYLHGVDNAQIVARAIERAGRAAGYGRLAPGIERAARLTRPAQDEAGATTMI